MFYHGVSAYSEDSESAAVATAVSEAATDYKGEAESVHIILSGVSKAGKGWKATTLVIVEPNLDQELDDDDNANNINSTEEEYIEEIDVTEGEEDNEGDGDNEGQIEPDSSDDDINTEDIDTPEETLAVSSLLEETLLGHLKEQQKNIPEDRRHITTSVYISSKNNDVYDNLNLDEKFFHTHLVEEGPMWDVINKFSLDNEFYESTHSDEVKHRTELEERANKKLNQEREDEQNKKSLSDKLTDDFL